jgi:DNA-binding NtrC family response regulator
LQDKCFVRPGTSDPVEVDVRVLATNPTNGERAAEKKLGGDLFHYLRTYTIHVPPLRERKDELPLLSRHFMHRLAKQYGLSPRDFSPAIIEAWQAYHWPENLRELEHFVKRYLLVGDKELAFEWSRSTAGAMAQGTALARPGSVRSRPAPTASVAGTSDFNSLRSLVQSVKSEAEKSAIALALERTGGNRKAAARALKVSYRSLLYKIEQYKMARPSSTVLPPGKRPRSAANGLSDNGYAEWAQAGK